MEQILDKKHSKKINLFEQSIRSEYTKKVYMTCLRKYLEFPGSSKIIDITDGRKVESLTIEKSRLDILETKFKQIEQQIEKEIR